MAQHFLLSSQARSLSLVDLIKLSDDQAHELFKTLRWGKSDNDMVCPTCGVVHAPYKIQSRKQYRCKHCHHTFQLRPARCLPIINCRLKPTFWRLYCL